MKKTAGYVVLGGIAGGTLGVFYELFKAQSLAASVGISLVGGGLIGLLFDWIAGKAYPEARNPRAILNIIIAFGICNACDKTLMAMHINTVTRIIVLVATGLLVWLAFRMFSKRTSPKPV